MTDIGASPAEAALRTARDTDRVRVNAPDTDPKSTSTRGAALLGARQLLTIALGAVSVVLLARWLTPYDFGLFATLNIIVFGAATLLGDLGLTVSLVRKVEEPSVSEWAAAKRMTAALSTAALACGGIGAAVLVSRGSGRLALWVAVLVVALATRFGRAMASARLQRQRRFGSLAGVETAETLVYFVSVISLAASGQGAGSLVLAVGAKELLGYVALRYVARGGATTRGVKGSYRELLRVGLPVQASGMLVALTDAFQPIFIGAVLGLQTLGQVSWAYNLVLMPILLIGAIDRVLLPSLARVQEDRVLLGLLTARAVRLNALIAFPVVAAVLVAPNDLITIVFTAQWLPASDLLVLFMPAIVTTAMTAPLLHAFNAIGRTRVPMYLSSTWLVLTWVLGSVATATWGAIGFGWFYVVLQLAYIPVWRFAKNELDVNVITECRDALAGLVVGVVGGTSVSTLFGASHRVEGLLAGIIVAELLFAITIWVVDHERTKADVLFLARGLAGKATGRTSHDLLSVDDVQLSEPRWRLTHVKPFDGLRALAVLAVMVSHAHIPGGLGGFLGVDVFFVLSGFLITALLIQERDRNGHIDFKRFYGRRALRLFPALLVMTTVVGIVLVAWPSGDLRSDSLASLPFAVTYLMNYVAMVVDRGLGVFGHTWSLAIEEQFYLLWPPVLALGLARFRQTSLAVLAVAAAALIVVVRAIVWLGTADVNLVYFPFHARGDVLLVGCAAALVMTASPARLVEAAGQRTKSVALIAGTVIAAIAAVTTTSTGWLYLFGLAMVAICSIVIIAQLAAHPTSLAGRLLSWRPLAFIGTISYGLYLWHVPVFELIKDRYPTLPFRYLLILQFGGSFVAALASYHIVEKPLLTMKKYLTV